MMRYRQINATQVKTSGWAYVFETNAGTFVATRNERLDTNGNPRWTISPLNGYYNELPHVAGYRRKDRNTAYTTQSYDIKADVSYLVEELLRLG